MTTRNNAGHPIRPGFARVQVGPRDFRFIRILTETSERVVGERVTKDGGRWEQETNDTIRTEMVICSPSEIRQRLALNLHYCELEPQA